MTQKHTLLAAARELFRIAQLRLTMPTKKKVDKKTSMQINREEKDPRGEQRNAPANKFDNNVPPIGKELCGHVVEFAVSSPFKENHNPDKGSSR